MKRSLSKKKKNNLDKKVQLYSLVMFAGEHYKYNIDGDRSFSGDELKNIFPKKIITRKLNCKADN